MSIWSFIPDMRKYIVDAIKKRNQEMQSYPSNMKCITMSSISYWVRKMFTHMRQKDFQKTLFICIKWCHEINICRGIPKAHYNCKYEVESLGMLNYCYNNKIVINRWLIILNYSLWREVSLQYVMEKSYLRQPYP